MRTRAPHILGATAAFAIAALPALPQSLGLPNPVKDAGSAAQIDINNGRFVAMGGMFGNQRIDCVRCHGLDGSGDSSGAFPRLSNQSSWYLYKTLQDYASGHRPNVLMQPIAHALTERERRNVAAYYASIKDAPYPEKPNADVQTLQSGGAIAAIGVSSQGVPACSGCHGPQGTGNGPIYPYLAGQFASYLQHQLILWKKGERHSDPLNIMETIAKAMTEDQIRAVSVYYASVRSRKMDSTEPSPQKARGQTSSPHPSLGARPPSLGARPPYLSTPPAQEPNAAPARQ